MKKFYLCLMALTLFISACTKVQPEKALTPSKNFGDVKSSFVVETNNFYVDLDLIPRAPGENYDTYHCLIQGKDIYVNNVYWDSTTYPSLYTGVPLYGEVHSGPEPGNTSDIFPYTTYASQAGISGTTFTLTIPTLCGVPNGAKLHTDIDKYLTALYAYGNTTPTTSLPYLGDFVGNDYGTENCPQTTISLKLIRSSTSSTGFAVASSNYPATIQFPSVLMGVGLLNIQPGNKYYNFYGMRGNISSWSYQTSTQLYEGSATGTYVFNSDGSHHLVGSFVDETGVTIPFDFLTDAN